MLKHFFMFTFNGKHPFYARRRQNTNRDTNRDLDSSCKVQTSKFKNSYISIDFGYFTGPYQDRSAIPSKNTVSKILIIDTSIKNPFPG